MSLKRRLDNIQLKIRAHQGVNVVCVNYGNGWQCPGMEMGTFKEDCPNKCPLEELGQDVFRVEYKYGLD